MGNGGDDLVELAQERLLEGRLDERLPRGETNWVTGAAGVGEADLEADVGGDRARALEPLEVW